MAFERMIKNAFEQSQNNCRFGDTIEEIMNSPKTTADLEIQLKKSWKFRITSKMLKGFVFQIRMELKWKF